MGEPEPPSSSSSTDQAEIHNTTTNPVILELSNGESTPPPPPLSGRGAATTVPDDVNNTATARQLKRAERVYKGTDTLMDYDRPSRGEVWVWYVYELCSHSILTTLLPVIFPLIISQVKGMDAPVDEPYWEPSDKSLSCRSKQMDLYRALTRHFVPVGITNFSALQWTSFSWGLGLILAAPLLTLVSTRLDHGRSQLLIAAGAIATGAFFCLPTGFFSVSWIFPPYIAAIIAAHTVAAATHTRQLGLMIRRFTGPETRKEHFETRRGVSGWLSLYAIAAGGIGSAIMSMFTYYMLRENEKFVSLWVVSIFSGLKWAAGIIFVLFIKPGTGNAASSVPASSLHHSLSIFRYPQALGGLIVSLLGSFTTMCIFTTVALYLVGELCFRPMDILYVWLTYFLVPVASLPILHPLQRLLKANAAKMHLLGFLLALSTTGVGFYYRESTTWKKNHVFFFAAVQSTSAGLLHAFERVLVVDSSPEGKEGAFAGWLSWSRTSGALLGFAVASAMPGNLSSSFGVAFVAAVVGSLVLVYGNIGDLGGAVAAENVVEEDDEDGYISVGIEKEGSPQVKRHWPKVDVNEDIA